MIESEILTKLKGAPVTQDTIDRLVKVIGLQYRALKLCEYSLESNRAAMKAADALTEFLDAKKDEK